MRSAQRHRRDEVYDFTPHPNYSNSIRWFLLKHINRVGSQPNIQLLKVGFDVLLELKKKLPVFQRVSNIHKHSHQIIAINNPLVLPLALDGLILS